MTEEYPGLNMAALQSWLATHVREFDTSAPPAAILLAGGRSNVTYRLDDAAGRAWALRRPPLGHVMPTAHDMSREFTVMSGLGKVGYPVPAMRAFCDDGDVIGAPFIIMDFVSGTSIATHEDALAISADQRSSASECLVEALVGLHSVDLAAAELETFGKHGGYLGRQVDRWAHQWTLTKTRDLQTMDDLFQWLNAHRHSVDDTQCVLVHGDLRLDNILMNDTYDRPLAVVDWEMSTLGHPIADLAVSLVYWSEPGDHLRDELPVARAVSNPPGFWSRSDLVERYVQGRDTSIADLDYATALACAKLAVIMESIHFRQCSGQQLGASAERNEDMGRATEALAQLGIAVTQVGAMKGLAA